MATIIEGSMPLSVESSTNATQHRASGLVESLWSSYSATSNWQLAITALLVLVAYDQCKLLLPYYIHSSPTYSRIADMRADLYISRKGSIAGPKFKIPLIGPFLQAIYPKFDAYLAQWASGPLSCVSVFHK